MGFMSGVEINTVHLSNIRLYVVANDFKSNLWSPYSSPQADPRSTLLDMGPFISFRWNPVGSACVKLDMRGREWQDRLSGCDVFDSAMPSTAILPVAGTSNAPASQ